MPKTLDIAAHEGLHFDRHRPLTKYSRRESGIELLKIIAIFAIVISHTVQTLTSKNTQVGFSDYVFDISHSTTDALTFVFMLFRYLGQFGNIVFFICSAWFLVDSSKSSGKKVVNLIFEIWSVSIIILVITYALLDGNISKNFIFNALFPTSKASNWYMTCYILFYLIHPFLNGIADRLTQKRHLLFVSVAFFLYYIVSYLHAIVFGGTLFFASSLIQWSVIYFTVSYIKKYTPQFCENIKANFALLFLACAGHIFVVFAINVIGLKIDAMDGKALNPVAVIGPFLIIIAITLFNIFRKLKFKNILINYVSSLSMLIYIIHENILLRTYFRPRIWQYIFLNYGYTHLLLWVFALALAIFVCSFAVSSLYRLLFGKLNAVISNKLYNIIKSVYRKYEAVILKIK